MPNGKVPHLDMLRSPLGRARGLGSARAGSGHWWAQRITALALVPLSLWFICAAIRLQGASRADVAGWLHRPVPLVLMISLVIATFYHLQLGLQVVIEDYLQSDALRLASNLLIKAAAFVLALACIVSVLHLGF
jgi:succinate dehydrogenase / fumarate reductase, membrane anchor subunit